MEVAIYNRDNSVAMVAAIDDSSSWNAEVGVENVVTLNFTTWEFVSLAAGCRIEIEGEIFKLRKAYKPKQVNGGRYNYSVAFHGREHDAEDLLFCRLNQGEDDLESVFQYEGTPAELLEKVVANLNRNSDGFVWKAGEAITAPRASMNFNGVYCWEALGQIAQQFKTEWWRDGEYINLTKCEHGEALDLGYLAGLRSGPEQSELENAVGFYTRLLPIGSAKNIDKGVYGFDRLQLPGREKYIDVNKEQGLKEHREESAFAEIYPKRRGVVSDVYTEEKNDEQHGDYTVFFFADEELPFNPDECMLPGKKINVRFATGELAGKDFEVIWHGGTERFEIINVYPDEVTQLPGGRLIPKPGDEYVLWNIAMPVEYYKAAEEEFGEAVEKFIEESELDNSAYTAQTDYIDLGRRGVKMSIGRRVRLLSDRYFEGGVKVTRITKIARKLTRLNDASIECRNAVVKSWKSSVDSSLNSINYSIAKELETAMIELLQTGDRGAATDYNVLSALRALNTFVRKDRPESSNVFTRFMAGIQAGLSRINEDGSAELKRLAVEGDAAFQNGVSSSEFVSGLTGGKGWAINERRRVNVAGKEEVLTSAEVDELVVRKSLKVFEFVVSQLLGENDNRIFAGMMVVDHYDAERGVIYLKTDNGRLYNCFRTGDVIEVRQFAGEEVIKSYELIVTSAGVGNLADGEKRLDFITFKDFAAGVPEELIAEGDTLVRVDSVSDETRKGVIQVTSVGADAPYIDVVRGRKTNPDDALKARLGNLDGIYDEAFGDEQPEGSGLYAQNAFLKGKFVLSSGEDVKTTLAATEGRIKSAVKSLQRNEMSGKSVVYNAAFTDGLKGWQTDNETTYYGFNGTPLFFAGKAAGERVKVVADGEYEGEKFFLRMDNSAVVQVNEYFAGREKMDEEKPVGVVFGVRYRTKDNGLFLVALRDCDEVVMNACRGRWSGENCEINGTIAVMTAWGVAVEFAKIDTAINAGDVVVVTKSYRLFNLTAGKEVKFAASSVVDGASLALEERLNVLACGALQPKKEFYDFAAEGRWNGSGDMEIAYDGLIELYGVQLYSQPTEIAYATLFEQTDRLAKFATEKIDDNGNTVNGAEVRVETDGEKSGTFIDVVYRDENNSVKRQTLGEFSTETDENGEVTTKIKLSGDNVILEGTVSANGKVKIEDGALIAEDGKFQGEVVAEKGQIGKFEIGEGLEYNEGGDYNTYEAKVTSDGAEFSDKWLNSIGIERRKRLMINGRFTDPNDVQILRCERVIPGMYDEDDKRFTFIDAEPMVELRDESSYPTVVEAIKGGFELEGGLLHKFAWLEITDTGSANELGIYRGTHWVVKMAIAGVENWNVYLPKSKDVQRMLRIGESDKFAIPMSVAVFRSQSVTGGVVLRFQESEGFFLKDIETSQVIEVAAGNYIDFLLCYEESVGYHAIIKF